MRYSLLILMSVIIISGLLSSCKNSEIIKRKYNKGYYISHSGKKQTKQSSAETKPIDPSTTTSATESKPEVTTELVVPENTENQTASVPEETKSEPASASDIIRKLHKRTQAIGSTIPLGITSDNSNAEDNTNNNSVLNQSSDPAHEALSLLWIVIVVILIVYLIGLLLDGFGLGLAIHVLAVIALVLLILWLLRIL